MNKYINQQCLESILSHLTKLIKLTEFENIKDLDKLVNMATSVSAQLLAVSSDTTEENSDENEEDDNYE